jgi:hypothetical protein
MFISAAGRRDLPAIAITKHRRRSSEVRICINGQDGVPLPFEPGRIYHALTAEKRSHRLHHVNMTRASHAMQRTWAEGDDRGGAAADKFIAC